MSDNETLLHQAERLANFRRAALIVNALCYAGWMLGMGMTSGQTDQAHRGLWLLEEAAAFSVWLISLLAILWTIRHARRRRDLGALIDDERTQGLTIRAFQTGYWLLLLPLAALYTLSWFVAIDLRQALLALMALGVAAPSLTYGLFYRN
ncbi:MAG: hypothetical protein ACTHLA_07425 [Asticcacaulis sp.]|uniref:hypothetical protein n=1 Tax=Asticcacaulis sp. TaxID=1872648 RepID=UPI003F7C2981